MTTLDELGAAVRGALAAHTRDALTTLLTDDVRWGGEHGGNECTDQVQAGEHYQGLLDAGVTLHVAETYPEPAGAAGGSDGERLLVRLEIRAPDPDEFPSELTVRLTLRDGLIADIRELDPPPTIELLYFDGCPNHETFLPHLRNLLDEHRIAVPVTLVAVESHEEAQAAKFLGSPTLRVNRLDVDPTLRRDAEGLYALQCRLYTTPAGNAGSPPDQWILDALIANPILEAAIAAIRTGDLSALRRLLGEHPELATTRLVRHQGRTLLHIATDWPGHFPNIAATIGVLVGAGADPNAPSLGEHAETPLHWAASSGDLEAIDALLQAGADIDAPGAVIAGGTPMADATAYGEWDAAHRLLARGASTNLFEAAALGLVARVEAQVADEPTSEDLTSSFWGACHGGQLKTAEVLLASGADLNWVGYDDLTPLDAALRAEATDVVEWLRTNGATSTPGAE